MWYDTATSKPLHGSLLETIFVYIYLRRAEQELMSTRALIQALVAQAPANSKMQPAIKAFEEYFDAMMPTLEKAATEQDEAKKALLEMTKHPLRIGLGSVYAAQDNKWKHKSRMKVPKAKVIGVRKRRAAPKRIKPPVRPRIPGVR